MKFISFFSLLLLSITTQAQVGIGTTTPASLLDVVASNPTAPINTDGILIPRIQNFPTTDPTIAQDGMLVYYNGTGTSGFYYWDGTTAQWLPIDTTGSDHDWYVIGAPGILAGVIGQSIYTEGNVGIGTAVPINARLEIEDATDTLLRGIDIELTGSSNGSVREGISVSNNNDGSTWLVGTANSVTANGTGVAFGVTNTVGGSGSGIHYGIESVLEGTGNGSQRGIGTVIENTGDGTHSGIYCLLKGTGTGRNYGMYSQLDGTGNGKQYGVYTSISNEGDDNHYGVYNLMNGGGTDDHYGAYNEFSYDETTGNVYGTYNRLAGTDPSSNYGTYNFIGSAGSSYGTYNRFFGNEAGTKYGVYNSIANTSSGTHYGAYTTFTGNGDGTKYGSYVNIQSSGTGSNPGTGIGTKYGYYARISNSDPATRHYGVYSDAQKAGSNIYAGYFLGQVSFGTAGDTYVFPTGDGTAGQTLITDGAGNLTWSNASGITAKITNNEVIKKLQAENKELSNKLTVLNKEIAEIKKMISSK